MFKGLFIIWVTLSPTGDVFTVYHCVQGRLSDYSIETIKNDNGLTIKVEPVRCFPA